MTEDDFLDDLPEGLRNKVLRHWASGSSQTSSTASVGSSTDAAVCEPIHKRRYAGRAALWTLLGMLLIVASIAAALTVLLLPLGIVLFLLAGACGARALTALGLL